MSESNKKNTERVGRNIKPLLSLDWTKKEGETPFFVPVSGSSMAYYGVAVDTGISQYHLLPADKSKYKKDGLLSILEHYNKESSDDSVNSLINKVSIPGEGTTPQEEATGLYVPLRPGANIKLLITIPEILQTNAIVPGGPTTFSNLPEKVFIPPAVYDEIQLNTYGLEKKVTKVSGLLEKYHSQMIDFEGKVYNADLAKEAERLREIVPILRDLIRTNGFFYSDSQADLVMLGMSGSGLTGSVYLPQYAQINQGSSFNTLASGFREFADSPFVTSNTMYLYKNLDELTHVAMLRPSVDKSTGSGSAPMGWEHFINEYIKFPPPIIEYTTGRPRSPDPKSQMQKEVTKANSTSIKDSSQINDESWRIRSKEFKKEMNEFRKQSKDFVGDTVIGNLNKTINTVNTLEDLYYHWLNKLGITYIVDAAVKCLNLDLPIEEIKGFLLDVNRFAGEVLDILKIPVISLDDIIPTVDIMGDIVEQILLAIGEAVKKALISMVKQVVMMYLEACGDPCKLNFGGLPIGQMLSEGNTQGVLAGALGVMGENVGGAVLDGMKAGVVSPGINDQSRKFMSNLQSHVNEEQMSKLTAPLAQPASQVAQAATQATQQVTQTAAQALSQSPIGSYLDTLSNTLTCGEVNKMLQGKTTSDTITIVQSTADQLCALDPETYGPLCELLSTEDKINDFFGNVGKLVNEGPIQTQIDNFEDITPLLATSLCDTDDSFLRCELLQGKGITSLEVCNAQIEASRERARNRINELSNLLDTEDPLEGVVPPVYCMVDDNGNFIEGLIKQDHPSYTFMMDRVIDTTFDGIYNSFINDISYIPELLSPAQQVEGKEIPRIITTATGKEIINPEFKMHYDQGQRPKGGIPFWESPMTSSDPSSMSVSQEKTIQYNKQSGATPIQVSSFQNVFLPGLSNTGSSGNNTGLYTMFQTSLRENDFSKNRNIRNRLNSRNKVMQYTIEELITPNATNPNNPQLSQLDGVKNYIRSQFDPQSDIYKAVDEVFAVNQYALFYTQFSTEPIIGKENFAVSIQGGTNVLWSKAFQTNDIPSGAQEVITDRALEINNLDPVNVPVLAPNAPPKVADDFSVVERRFAEFVSDSWNNGESIYRVAADNTMSKLDSSERPSYANARGSILQVGSAGSNTNQLTNTLLQEQGSNLFRTGNQAELVSSLYNELLRDLQAMCLKSVSESRLLDGNIFRNLNFTPQPCPTPDPFSQEDKSLMDMESIKQKLKEVYNNVKCIEPTYPNVCGLGTNKDNALEQSILYGIIQATARLYSLEAALKCAPTFSVLTVDNIDEVLIDYISTQALEEIGAKFYLDSFLSQCLKSYNSLAAHQPPSGQPLSDPRKAFNWFIKEELKTTIESLLELASVSAPAVTVDELLFSTTGIPPQISNGHWLPQFDVSSSVGSPGNPLSLPIGASNPVLAAPGLQRLDEQIRLSDYGVQDFKEIVGLKDWRNGNLYLETYIRAEYKENNTTDSTSAFPPLFYQSSATPVDIPMDYRGVVNKELFSLWANSEFFSILPSPTTTVPFFTEPSSVIPQDDCAEADIVIPGDTFALPTESPDPTRLGSYFKSLRYGLRLVCQVVNDTSQNNDGVTDQPFHQNMQNSYDVGNAKLNKAYHYKEQTFNKRIDAYTIPLVCVEVDEPLDTPIETINTNANYFTEQYDTVYRDLVGKLKSTNEYSFIFDYCFPLDRLVSLTALYGITYSLPFPGLNNAFLATKEQLRMAFNTVSHSGDYKSRDLVYNNRAQALATVNGGELPGFDFGKIIEQFLWGMLKGAGETFDPNIAVAKKIKDAMELIGPALTSAINRGKQSVGRLQGQSEEEINRNLITECQLNLPDIDIPMLLISLGLMPVNIFGVPPLGIGYGPPISGLGGVYLGGFGYKDLPGSRALKTADEKKQDRCKILDAGGPDLTGKDNCDPVEEPVDLQFNSTGKDECD